MTITEAEMMNRTFGCELEYEGISQSTAAKTVAEVTGGTTRYVGGTYGTWEVAMPDGRKWKVVSDGSLRGTSSETVTPVMTVADLDTLQKVVRALRRKGAKANSRTGLHVHVGAADFTAENVKNLVKTFYKQETLILKAAGTLPARIERYTQKTDHGFVDKICRMRNPTMDGINRAWFGTFTPHPYHYESHRYHALNLNNLWNDKGTVEFRFWEGTTDHKRVAANVLFCLLLVARAKDAKASSAKSQRPYNEASAKYDFRVFLLRLGANGPMFKSMRKILMANLPGSAAWKDGRHDKPRANAEAQTGAEARRRGRGRYSDPFHAPASAHGCAALRRERDRWRSGDAPKCRQRASCNRGLHQPPRGTDRCDKPRPAKRPPPKAIFRLSRRADATRGALFAREYRWADAARRFRHGKQVNTKD